MLIVSGPDITELLEKLYEKLPGTADSKLPYLQEITEKDRDGKETIIGWRLVLPYAGPPFRITGRIYDSLSKEYKLLIEKISGNIMTMLPIDKKIEIPYDTERVTVEISAS